MHGHTSFEIKIDGNDDNVKAINDVIKDTITDEGFDEGKGVFLSTYQGPGEPLPSFAGEPLEIDMPDPDAVWGALNTDNKVSLYAKVGKEVKLYNKNLGD